LHSVVFSLYEYNLAVMDYPINDSWSQNWIPEHILTFLKAFIGGNNDDAFLMTAGDDLIELTDIN